MSALNSQYILGSKKEVKMQYTQNAIKIPAVIQSLSQACSTTRSLALLMLENNSRVNEKGWMCVCLQSQSHEHHRVIKPVHFAILTQCKNMMVLMK